DAALDLLDALLEVAVAGIDVAPGIDDGDHRIARIVGAVIAHLRGARAVAERTQVLDAVPAVAAQILGALALGCVGHDVAESFSCRGPAGRRDVGDAVRRPADRARRRVRTTRAGAAPARRGWGCRRAGGARARRPRAQIGR